MPNVTTGTIVVDCTSSGGSPEVWESNTGSNALPLVETLREYTALQGVLGAMGKKVTVTVTKVTD
jgi:hypothetical protein